MLPVNQQDPKTPKRATLDVKRQIFMVFILAEHKMDLIVELNKDSFASETFLVDGKSMEWWMACPTAADG